MSNLGISAEEILELFNDSNTNDNIKLDYINKLKTHIKKDSIDTKQVDIFLEIIIKGLDIHNLNISSISFNSLSYLIKRISVQDKSGKILRNQSLLILPILINKLYINSSKKALEDYWLSAPHEVEDALSEISFNNNNVNITIESVKWLNQVFTKISKKFNVSIFIPHILRSTNFHSGNKDLVQVVKVLFKNYYTSFPEAISNLQTEMDLNDVLVDIQKDLLATIRPAKNLPKKKPGVIKLEENGVYDDYNTDLQDLLTKVHCTLSTELKPLDVRGVDDLYNMFDSFSPCFESKETEINWKIREKNIVKIRNIIRGNAMDSYRSDLISCLKNLAHGLSKGAQSLRTTLCGHSCQLLKECAMILKHEFEPVAEILFPNLIRLCSSTKNITSTNANMTVCALYANLPYNQKLIQKILSALEEKNPQPRSYTGIWLQIIILRYGIDSSFLGSHESFVVESSNKVLSKLLKDANPKARQIAKDCYFCYSKIFPTEVDKLMKRLDSNTIKALERSQKTSAQTTRPSSQHKSSRTSIKEAILEKNKELREKQHRPPSRSTTDRSHSIPLPKVSRPLNPKPITRHERFSKPTTRASSWTSQLSSPIKPPIAKRVSSSIDLKQSPFLESKPTSSKSSPNKRVSNSSFDSHRDPIIEFLSSNDQSIISEGVGLLKYSIIGKVTLPEETKEVLQKLSNLHPQLLKPIFASGDSVFKKSSALFDPNDFIRICSFIFPNPDEKTLELITSCIEIPQFYQSSIYLLTCIIDAPRILGSQEFMTQMTNHKFEMTSFILTALSISLNKLSIEVVQFAALLNELIRSIKILKASSCYGLLSQLFCQLYSIDSENFMDISQATEETLKEEIESIVGIDTTMQIKRPLSKSLFDLTEVIPSRGQLKSSPKKISPKKFDDFTMIMPRKDTFMNNEVSQRPLKLVKAAPIIEQPKSEDLHFIEKSDPLRLISNKVQKISIYEDEKQESKPKKDKNWANFHFAKVLDNQSELNLNFNINVFEMECKKLITKPKDDLIIRNLILSIESLSSAPFEFREYFLSKGKLLLEDSLWEYFTRLNSLNYQQVANGLYLLTQLLKFNSEAINVTKVWMLLKETCINERLDSEIYFIWHEILLGFKVNFELQEIMLNYLEQSHLNTTISNLTMEYVSKCLYQENKLDTKKIYRIDEILSRLFNNKEVAIRKTATICYSNLVKNTTLSTESKEVLNKVKSKYPLAQQRLIEFYSHR
ncbi:unnamed protein product [Candida verbasci]|uniref:Protein STU1 n=1 Tax=Candida verbasci TaxID=1227364 RepID=A0A9W4TU84_9ASCO|nr:unnamed protein product [Candida verbasci]